MSSNGTVETRRQEAAEASAVLGLSDRSCLGLPDRGLTGSAEQIEAIVRKSGGLDRVSCLLLIGRTGILTIVLAASYWKKPYLTRSCALLA